MHQQNLVLGGYSRLTRDAAELLTADFTCSASSVIVTQTSESLNEPGSIALEINVFEGAYRGGRFYFCFQIPANYPFKSVEVWATNPIWHPNVDIRCGRMSIPLEWSPVLTLKTFARTVQMLMIEPSAEVPLNVNALSLFSNSPAVFDRHAQQSLRGGWFEGVYFHPCSRNIPEPIVNIEPLERRKRKLSLSDSNDENDLDDLHDVDTQSDAMDQDCVYYHQQPNSSVYNSRLNSNSNGSLFETGPQDHISKLSLQGNDDNESNINHHENSLLKSPIVRSAGSSPQRKYRKIIIPGLGSPILQSSQQFAMMVEDAL